MSGFLSTPIFDADRDETLASCFPIENVCLANDLKTFIAGPCDFDLLLLVLCDDLVLEILLAVADRSVTAGGLLVAIIAAGTGTVQLIVSKFSFFARKLCSILVRVESLRLSLSV